jgi:hypothetical protein
MPVKWSVHLYISRSWTCMVLHAAVGLVVLPAAIRRHPDLTVAYRLYRHLTVGGGTLRREGVFIHR